MLHVEGTQSCNPDALIRERLAEHLGPDWEVLLSHATSIEVRIERNDASFTAHVQATIEGETLARSLDSPRCEVLGAATALVIAVAAAPIVTATQLEEAPPAAPEPPPTPDPPREEPLPETRSPGRAAPPDPPAPRSEPRHIRPSHWLRAAVGAGAGPLPRTGLAAGLRYLATWRHLGLGAELGYQVPRAVRYDDGQGVRVQAISASVVACPGLYGEKGHISGCGGVRGSLIPVRPQNVTAPTPVVLGWAGGLVGLDVGTRPLPWLEIGASVEGVLSFVRPAVHVDVRDPVYRAPLAGWQALVGVAFRLH